MTLNSYDIIDRLVHALEAISNDTNRLLDDEEGEWDVDIWDVIAGIRKVTDEALDDCGYVDHVYTRKESLRETND